MFTRKRLLLVGLAMVFIAGAAAAISIATSEDQDTPITGDALAKASAAALRYTGGGTVTDTEVGDEEGYYEVEVRLEDGTEMDVHLDANFTVIGSNSDTEDTDSKE